MSVITSVYIYVYVARVLAMVHPSISQCDCLFVCFVATTPTMLSKSNTQGFHASVRSFRSFSGTWFVQKPTHQSAKNEGLAEDALGQIARGGAMPFWWRDGLHGTYVPGVCVISNRFRLGQRISEAPYAIVSLISHL